MTFGSLFAGIGGMDLGLERAGWKCEWQVEIDPFCRRVLAKHWPDVRRHDDVATFLAGQPEPWQVDLIAGGFPCQDISAAGRRIGIEGPRSGLWRHFKRIIRVLRPRFVIVENVPRLLSAGLGVVLGDLAGQGYDAEWTCIPASLFDAKHRRYRVFVVAYPFGQRFNPGHDEAGILGKDAAEEGRGRSEGWDPRSIELVRGHGGRVRAFPSSGVRRVDDGFPDRLDRYRTLGNAVVPQVAEWIGRRILSQATEES